jgi:ParB/RepB/Spo0J family partition protein
VKKSAQKPRQKAAKTAADNSASAITTLPVEQLQPNDYNPNHMTTGEFAEFVAEVRHLGKLPKPVIVRRNGDGYLIVDGEHGWKAAKEVGLAEIPCEVIDADDFESMRQTYKRNQHGTHNPVRLGQMFRRMMGERSLSARALAKEIAVSEGTVRNAILYAEAFDLRNSYAPDEPWVVQSLSVRQVRCYTGLPPRVAQLWLDCGGDMKTLLEQKDESGVETSSRPEILESILRSYHHLEETGLFQFVGNAWSASGFVEAIKKVRHWNAWEHTWLRYGIDRETFRGYSRHFFEKKFHVRDERMMESAIGEILDQSVRPPAFLLSAEEFTTILDGMGSIEPESHSDFMRKLSLAVSAKIGQVRQTKGWVKRQLLEQTLEGAPDFIRDSPLDAEAKYALWTAEVPEEAKREIAQYKHLPLTRAEDDGTEDGRRACIKRLIQSQKERQEMERQVRAALEGKSEQELAQEMARRFVIYDQEKDTEAIAVLAGQLARLTKPELVFLVTYAERLEYYDSLALVIRALAGIANMT